MKEHSGKVCCCMCSFFIVFPFKVTTIVISVCNAKWLYNPFFFLSLCCSGVVIIFWCKSLGKQCSDDVVLQGSVNTSLETLQLLASGSTNLSNLKKQQKSSLVDSEEKDSKATLSHQVRQENWRLEGRYGGTVHHLSITLSLCVWCNNTSAVPCGAL